MLNLSVIVLTGNEELHIVRCLRNVVGLAKDIFVVDSLSTDRTQEIVESFSEKNGTTIHFVSHEWPGLYALQFNWALDNLPIGTEWVLRLDADEYLTPETIEKLKSFLSSTSNLNVSDSVTGLNLELKRRFCGGEIRHGTVGIRQARIFRAGIGRCEERAMDEHIILSSGQVIDFDGAFYDDNLNDMDWWREKHRGYAKREAADALAFARGEVRFKRSKEIYYKQPRYLRCLVYFVIRYFLKLGFLDGRAGFLWNFWQGLWYRCLVDYEIGKMGRTK